LALLSLTIVLHFADHSLSLHPDRASCTLHDYSNSQAKLLSSSFWVFRADCIFREPAIKMVENMNTNFMSTYRFWAGNSIASSILLVKLAPAYSIGGSYTWTAVPLFLLQWLAYAIYSIILYPKIFSPLRHLPSPPVGVMSARENNFC